MPQFQPSSSLLAELERLYQQFGDKAYGEGCTQFQHMAQCGWWAEQKGYDNALIAAAFLHDIGHLLADDQQLPERDQWGFAHHDQLGADWLERHGVLPSITDPIAMHVDAKRYLVATDANYAAALSHASRITLMQQGGPMSATECQRFANLPAFADAIRLRQLDELGKADRFSLPTLTYWMERLPRLLAN